MKEFSNNLLEMVRSGLRRDERGSGMLSMYGVVPSEFGPRHYTRVTCPISPLTVTWPFPQLFRGKGITLLAYATTVYEVDESDWSVTPIVTYDALDESATKTITGSGPWHFIDFFDTWVLMNGTSAVFRTNMEGMLGGTNKTLVYNSGTIGTGCALAGRAVYGGFNTSNFWQEDWKALMEHFTGSTGAQVEPSLGMPSNFVAWTTIGGGDMLWPIYPEVSMLGHVGQGGYTVDRSRWKELMERNEAGFMPMPWKGTVLCVKRLGQNAIVYGDHGVAALIPVPEPVPTLGMRSLLGVGAASRGAIGGDEHQHVFVDATGYLWSIGEDMKPQRLGYHEFFNGMLGSNAVVSHDPEENEFYICDGTDCYVLNRAGLGEATELVTSLTVTDGGLVGVKKVNTSATFSMLTDSVGVDVTGIKMLKSIDVDMDGVSGLQVAVDTKYQKGDSFVGGAWVDVNREGSAYMGVSGTEFRVGVKGTGTSGVRLNGLSMRWQHSDKRYLRGVRSNAPQISA
jgi:hypothetical protein